MADNIGRTRSHLVRRLSSSTQSSSNGSSRRNSTDEAVVDTFWDQYKIGKSLGKGGFGEVFEAVKVETGRALALKVMTIASSNPVRRAKKLQLISREVDILQSLHHPRITRFVGMHAGAAGNTFTLITELCEGGEVLSQVTKKAYEESEARTLFAELMEGVIFIHSQGVLHGDLKLENLLLEEKGKRTGLKICDFGLARRLGPRKPSTGGGCGSIHYIAPELIRFERPPAAAKGDLELGDPILEYDEKIDIWSCGVLLYILLSGEAPFYRRKTETKPEVFAKIRAADFDFKGERWDEVSAGAKRLIKKLLTVDPTARPSAQDVMRDAWLSGARYGAASQSSLGLTDSVAGRAPGRALYGTVLRGRSEGAKSPPPSGERAVWSEGAKSPPPSGERAVLAMGRRGPDWRAERVAAAAEEEVEEGKSPRKVSERLGASLAAAASSLSRRCRPLSSRFRSARAGGGFGGSPGGSEASPGSVGLGGGGGSKAGSKVRGQGVSLPRIEPSRESPAAAEVAHRRGMPNIRVR